MPQEKGSDVRNCGRTALFRMPLIFILFPIQQTVTMWIVSSVLACCFLNSKLPRVKLLIDQYTVYAIYTILKPRKATQIGRKVELGTHVQDIFGEN